MSSDLLLYGSYGYTGSLITETATDAGLSPTLAGRRAEPVERQANDSGLDHRVFSLEHPDVVADQLSAFDAVLNCAGPFSETAGPLVEACLRTGTDYLDITGEIDVLERIAGDDRAAERADVTLLPGVGFDVVPTDCLAVYLHNQLPSGTHLRLAIDGLGTFGPGTLKSMVESLPQAGAARIDGEVRRVPHAWKTRQVDFGDGSTPAVTIPWGDVSTAYYATGIENIETYATIPPTAVAMMRRGRPLTPVLGAGPVQRALKWLVDATVSGPTADERARSTGRIWGEVSTDDGSEQVAARLQTGDTYDLTARTATESARRALEGDVEDGFQTPASAFGADYVLEFDGVTREDVRVGASGGMGSVEE